MRNAKRIGYGREANARWCGAFGEAKPKVARVFEPPLTLADMKEITGISIAAIQKLLDQLIQKKYVERGERDGSWGVFVIQ